MHIIHTSTVEEIVIQDGDKNVWEANPLEQVVQKQVKGL